MFIRNWRDMLMRAPEDGSGSGEEPASGGDEGASAPQGGSMFNPDAGGDAGEGQGEPPADGGDEDRPEWLLPKFKSAEDQAKAYRELYGRFSKKTEDLKAEVKEGLQEELMAERGVPEDVSGYEPPEDLKFELQGEFDEGLRNWAKEQGIGNEGYQQLLQLYNSSLPDFEAEQEKLGPNAKERLDTLNGWISKHIPEDHHNVVGAIIRASGRTTHTRSMCAASGLTTPCEAENETGLPASWTTGSRPGGGQPSPFRQEGSHGAGPRIGPVAFRLVPGQGNPVGLYPRNMGDLARGQADRDWRNRAARGLRGCQDHLVSRNPGKRHIQDRHDPDLQGRGPHVSGRGERACKPRPD